MGRFIIDERNNTSTSGFNEFDIRGRNVGSVCGIVETSRGAVARVAQNSDDRPVVEVGIWSDTGGGGVGKTELMILSWEKNR